MPCSLGRTKARARGTMVQDTHCRPPDSGLSLPNRVRMGLPSSSLVLSYVVGQAGDRDTLASTIRRYAPNANCRIVSSPIGVPRGYLGACIHPTAGSLRAYARDPEDPCRARGGGGGGALVRSHTGYLERIRAVCTGRMPAGLALRVSLDICALVPRHCVLARAEEEWLCTAARMRRTSTLCFGAHVHAL